MAKYLVVYSQVDDGAKFPLQKVMLAEDKNDAHNTMIYVAFVLCQEAQLYEWDNEDRVYKFIWRIEPERLIRKEINP